MRFIISRLRRIIYLAARKWLWIVMSALGIYISLPWLAPTLAQAGFYGPADVIYTIYSPFCHQFAFRSPFLYGKQLFYPRGVAGTTYKSFEKFALESPRFLDQYRYWQSAYYGGAATATPTLDDLQVFSVAQQFAARHFIGDEILGYKTSLCARDLAIYTMMFLGGLIYWRYRWRLRPLPFLIYIFVGLGPIALDGFSQLLSYPPFEFWQVRETEPLYRLVTGGLFGLMSAWLAFPHIERSMDDIATRLEATDRSAPE